MVEGYSLKPEYITQVHLNHSFKESTCDLRRTINALQVACLTLNVSRPEVETTSALNLHDDGDTASNEIVSTVSDEPVYNKPRISPKAIEAKSYIDGVLRGDSPQSSAVGSLISFGYDEH